MFHPYVETIDEIEITAKLRLKGCIFRNKIEGRARNNLPFCVQCPTHPQVRVWAAGMETPDLTGERDMLVEEEGWWRSSRSRRRETPSASAVRSARPRSLGSGTSTSTSMARNARVNFHQM